MPIIGIVGLPGSGKSTGIIAEYRSRGFAVFDDIANHVEGWPRALELIRSEANENIVFSDVMLCCRTPKEAEQVLGDLDNLVDGQVHEFQGRDEFEAKVGRPIEWIFFENDISTCFTNCRAKFKAINATRKKKEEYALLLLSLSSVYQPGLPARPVWRSSCDC